MRVPALSRPGSAALRERVGELSRSDTGRAAGLGAAMIVANILALGFTVVFARVLGASGYGDLAVLLSSFIIMMVPGSALQIAAAREVSHDLAEGNPNAGAGVRRWLDRLIVATVVVAVVAVPLRSLIATLINIDQDWAAAAIPVTAMLWIILSVLRGVLQGFQQYRTVAFSIVGEASSRIVFALILVAVGLDVTGAFLGSAFSLIAIALVLLIPLRRQLQGVNPQAAEDLRLRELLAGAWVPVLGLTLLLALQELHVIIVKHQASDDAAGSYAVAAVAGKAIMWIAIGLGLYLLPEASRRAKSGEDARPILLRTLGLIAAMAVPAVLIYSVAGEPLLRVVFGEDLTEASDALPFLGLAMSLLACSYLSVQYLLAMGKASFLFVLAAGVVAEVVLLLSIGDDLTAIALALLGIQAVCASTILTMAMRTSAPARQAYVPV
ncbi:MAG: oligosaccharide flippase family protein [Thermoleophilaceae bacterium]|nr:oligosaccharide flippase family protein [Thermoleophilaceae bacterium]